MCIYLLTEHFSSRRPFAFSVFNFSAIICIFLFEHSHFPSILLSSATTIYSGLSRLFSLVEKLVV